MDTELPDHIHLMIVKKEKYKTKKKNEKQEKFDQEKKKKKDSLFLVDQTKLLSHESQIHLTIISHYNNLL